MSVWDFLNSSGRDWKLKLHFQRAEKSIVLLHIHACLPLLVAVHIKAHTHQGKADIFGFKVRLTQCQSI